MDSSALVSASSANFAQQGSIDWVSLSKSPITFSIDLLARLSRAGIEPVTVAIGQALCVGVPMQPEAQKRLNDALSKLKPFASYNKIVYFGFGVRHILHDFRDYETGSACVALCASLMSNYDSWHAAQVLRELCIARAVPNDMLPSLHQWEALLNCCSGVLGASCKFPHLVEAFARHLRQETGSDEPMELHQPAKPAELAKCLNILFNVASGKISTVHFTGGAESNIECAWIGAVAEWMLCLTVEIWSYESNKSSRLVCGYRSQTSKATETQVIITPGSLGRHAVMVQSTTCVLSTLCIKADSPSAFMRHSPWTSILQDSFGLSTQILLDYDFQHYTPDKHKMESLAQPFSKLLGLLAASWDTTSISRADPSEQIRRSIERFRNYVTGRFPEFCAVTDLMSSTASGSELNEGNAWREFEMIVRQRCVCRECRLTWVTANNSHLQIDVPLCPLRLASTLVDILRLLYHVDIDEEILPSPNGFLRFYDENRSRPLENSISRSKHWTFVDSVRKFTPDLSQVLSLFAELPNSLVKRFHEHWSTLSSNGVCTFYSLLQDLELPVAQADGIRVVPGCLWLNGHKYNAAIESIEAVDMDEKDMQSILKNDLPIRLVATEGRDPKILHLGYQASYKRTWHSIYCTEIVLTVPYIRGDGVGICNYSGCNNTFGTISESKSASQIPPHFCVQLNHSGQSPHQSEYNLQVKPDTWLLLLSISSGLRKALQDRFTGEPVLARVGFQFSHTTFAQLFAKVSLIRGLYSVGRGHSVAFTGCCIKCAIQAFEIENSYLEPNPHLNTLCDGQNSEWGRVYVSDNPGYIDACLVPDYATATSANPSTVSQDESSEPPALKTSDQIVKQVLELEFTKLGVYDEYKPVLIGKAPDERAIDLMKAQFNLTSTQAIAVLKENNGDALLTIMNPQALVFEEKDVDLVMTQVAGTTRRQALRALKFQQGDIVNAIMALST